MEKLYASRIFALPTPVKKVKVVKRVVKKKSPAGETVIDGEKKIVKVSKVSDPHYSKQFEHDLLI